MLNLSVVPVAPEPQLLNCTDIRIYEETGCDKLGYYCTFHEIFNVTGYISYDGLIVPDSNIDDVCSNITQASFCDAGFFCPSQFEKIVCPAGSYCNIGFSSPVRCSWALANCPNEMTSAPNTGVSLALYVFFLAIILFGFHKLILRHIKSKEAKYRSITSTVDTIDSLTLEREQRQVLAINFKKIASSITWLKNGTGIDDLFDEIDKDKSGTIETKELSDALYAEGVYVENHQIKSLLKLFDSDNDGVLSKEEFKGLIQKIFEDANDVGDEKLLLKNETMSFRKRQESFNNIRVPLNVSFTDLNLNLGNGDPVLQNVAGTVKAFNVTALMGPSGAGKTSLLNLLRGQAHYAKVQGNIYINGVAVDSLNVFSDRMAFVPQDDIMNDELTVEENILYAAVLFNKRGITRRSEIMPFVHYIEELLGIEFIRNSIVGSAERKGISGGQKKRVSVGMEMTKEAALFFLDEPTSGLDSATSMSLLNSLQEVSKKGVNIVATLHQPRQEIFDMLDCLILLAPGGKISYFGPAKGMAKHFSSMKYTPPPAANVTDFVMDVLAGFVRPDGEQKVLPIKQVISTITDYWEKGYQYVEPVSIGSMSVQSTEEKSRTWLANWLAVYTTSLNRELKVYERTFPTVIRTSISLAVLGLLIALLFGSVALKLSSNGKPAAPSIGGQISSAQLAFGLIVMTSGLKLFSHDHLLRLREESAGIILLPLYLGKLGASVFELVFYSYAFLSGYYPFVQPNAPFESYLLTFILLQFAIMGLANLISVTFTSSIKSLVASGVLVVFWAFGGIAPSYSNIVDRMGPLVILNWLSPFRWSFQLHCILELKTYSEAWSQVIQASYDATGWAEENESLCCGLLIIYAVVTNFLAVLLMELMRDNYAAVKSWKELICHNLLCSHKSSIVQPFDPVIPAEEAMKGELSL